MYKVQRRRSVSLKLEVEGRRATLTYGKVDATWWTPVRLSRLHGPIVLPASSASGHVRACMMRMRPRLGACRGSKLSRRPDCHSHSDSCAEPHRIDMEIGGKYHLVHSRFRALLLLCRSNQSSVHRLDPNCSVGRADCKARPVEHLLLRSSHLFASGSDVTLSWGGTSKRL